MEEPGVDPAVDPGADPAVEAPWAPPREEWEQLSGAVNYLAQLEQQRAAVYQPQPDGQQGPDFLDDPDGWLEAKLAQRLAPVQQFQQEAQIAEAEERARDILGDIASREGEFNVDLARMRADALLPAMQQRYGWGAKAAEAALEQAARDQRQYEQEVHAQAVSRYTNQIATLAGAPGEPGSEYTVGTQVRTMPDYSKGGRVTDRFFGQLREG